MGSSTVIRSLSTAWDSRLAEFHPVAQAGLATTVPLMVPTIAARRDHKTQEFLEQYTLEPSYGGYERRNHLLTSLVFEVAKDGQKALRRELEELLRYLADAQLFSSRDEWEKAAYIRFVVTWRIVALDIFTRTFVAPHSPNGRAWVAQVTTTARRLEPFAIEYDLLPQKVKRIKV